MNVTNKNDASATEIGNANGCLMVGRAHSGGTLLQGKQ